MEKYVLKNEDGTQSITTTLNDSEIAIGVWKIKSVKHSFIASLVSNLKYVGNPSFEDIYRRNQTYLMTIAINNILRKKRFKIVKDKLYLSILKHIQSVGNSKEYVTIHSILKHFSTTSTPIHKKVLLDMVKDDLISKSYHKVKIKKKGFEYLD